VEIHAATPAEAWVRVIRALDDAPEVAPRGARSREIPEPVHVRIEHPDAGLVAAEGRNFNHAVSVVEGLSLVGQCSVPEWQTSRVRALGDFQNRSVFRGAYGPRAEGVLDDIVDVLTRDPSSRQAVLSIYDSHRDAGRWSELSKSGDVPCTLAIQFLMRGGLLHMWVTMRSNDAWRGLPYDLGQFSILQVAIADALSLAVGPYTHSAGSMHLYEEHFSAAAKIGDAIVAEDTEWGFGWDYLQGNGLTPIARRARLMLMGDGVASPTGMEKDFIRLLS